MGLLKRMKDVNKTELEYTKKHLETTGAYGSIILDKILEHEAKPFIYEGKKQGYAEASDAYEKKLLEQADEFISQKKVFEQERIFYEHLLDEYDAEIDVLNKKLDKTEIEKNYLYELMLRERKLKNLK